MAQLRVRIVSLGHDKFVTSDYFKREILLTLAISVFQQQIAKTVEKHPQMVEIRLANTEVYSVIWPAEVNLALFIP